MSDKLIIQSVDSAYVKYTNLSRRPHERYAWACDADYRLFIGLKDEGVHPAWNRLPMFLEAFGNGYRKVVWLDADSLVVNQNVSIFADTDDSIPLQMTRVLDSHVELPWGEDGWDVYNDGVIVANNTAQAIDAFEWIWAQRHAPLLPHHHATLWELNFMLDVLLAHPEIVKELDLRWNWMPYAEAPPETEAVIRSFHGYPHDQRWNDFQAKYDEVYGSFR